MLGSLLLFFILAETITRLACPYLNERKLPYAETDDIAKQNEKNFYFEKNSNIDYLPHMTNNYLELGYVMDFFEKEFKLRKEPNIFRIIGLGDSHLESGAHLTDGLEERLNQLNLTKKVEVLNFGVGAYNLVQKKILLDEKLKHYDPDIILLQILDDDCMDERIFLPDSHIAIENTPFFEVQKDIIIPLSIPILSGINRELIRYSIFYRFISIKYYNIKKKAISTNLTRNTARCDAAMTEIVDITADIESDILVYVSHTMSADFKNYPSEKWMKNFVDWVNTTEEKHNLSIVRLFDHIKELDYKDYKIDNHGHYNEEMYEIAVQLVIDGLIKDRLIPLELIS